MLYLLFEKKKEEKKKKLQKEKGEMAKGLFPRADKPYWLCHAGIFLASRCY
jgi:hypothetical protein